MDKKIISLALNKIKIGFDNSGQAGKKHILVVSPVVEDYALSHGAQIADFSGEQAPICPECSSSMHLKQGVQKNSKYWSCSKLGCKGKHTYQPEWFYVGEVPAAIEEFVLKPAIVVDQQARAPQCPKCGGQMKLKSTRDGKREFWGCMGYPVCDGTRNAIAVLDVQMMDKPVPIASNIKATSEFDNPEVTKLIKYSITVLGSEKAAKRWLSTPNIYQLEGQAPFQVLTTSAGRNKVRAMLKTLYD
mgnify:FL=1